MVKTRASTAQGQKMQNHLFKRLVSSIGFEPLVIDFLLNSYIVYRIINIYIYIHIYLYIYIYLCIYVYTYIYIYARPPPPVRRQTQQKLVRAILSVEHDPVMVRHRQELYLSRDG